MHYVNLDVYTYIYIFTPSMNEIVKPLQYAFVWMRWVQQLQALQILAKSDMT